MKQGKGICKHDPYVAADFGLRETENYFLLHLHYGPSKAMSSSPSSNFTNMHRSETRKTQVFQ